MTTIFKISQPVDGKIDVTFKHADGTGKIAVVAVVEGGYTHYDYVAAGKYDEPTTYGPTYATVEDAAHAAVANMAQSRGDMTTFRAYAASIVERAALDNTGYGA